MNGGGGGGDTPSDGQHTPSTAERVKMFETELIEQKSDVDIELKRSGDGDFFDDKKEFDEIEGLERGGTRSSIAERRRMYESRSQSVQESTNPSPTPLRRRDSLKVLSRYFT